MQSARRLAAGPSATLRALQRYGVASTTARHRAATDGVVYTVRRLSSAAARPSSSARRIKIGRATSSEDARVPSAAALFEPTSGLAYKHDGANMENSPQATDKSYWTPRDRAKFRTMLSDCALTNMVPAGLRKFIATFPIMTTPWTDHELVLLVGALIKISRSDQALELLNTQIKDASDKNRLNRVAAESARLGNAMVAVGVLDIANHFNIEPDVITYTSAIHACARGDRDTISQAIDILEYMKKQGVEPNHRTYGAVILAYARMNQWDEIQELIANIPYDSELTKNDVFSAAIATCTQNRQFAVAVKLYGQLMDAGVYPGEKVSNTALSACARTSDMQQMQKIISFLEAHGQPSIYTYNTMLSAYSQAGRVDDSLEIYQRLQSRGFAPDAVTFNALLLGARRSRRSYLLPLILDNMNARGIEWDVYTLNGLLELSAMQGSVENARGFWQRAKTEQKLRYDRTNYETLFGVFFECGDYQAVIDLWNSDRDCRRRAKSAKTLNYLLRACSKLADVDTALSLLDEFVVRGQEPTAIAYNHILSTYLAADDWKGALNQLEMMAADPAHATTFAFTSMINHCFRKSEYDDVLAMYEFFLHTVQRFKQVWSPQLQYPPDAIHVLAARAAAHLQDHELLGRVYQRLPRSSLSNTVVSEVVRLLLASCEKQEDWRRAVAVYGEVSKHMDDATNVEFYEVVVKIVARAGAFERALEVDGGDWYRDSRHDKGWF